jgi:hypothetical protein
MLLLPVLKYYVARTPVLSHATNESFIKKGVLTIPVPSDFLTLFSGPLSTSSLSGMFWWRVCHRTPSRAAFQLLVLSALATGVTHANAAVFKNGSHRTIFDSDSFDILVDGGATACISNDLTDFVRPPKTSTVRVKGFNGTTSSTKVGTVRWSILDDSGQRCTLQIDNTYYVPVCPLCLLSPQQYSQQLNDHRGTYSINFGDQVVFVWN